MKKVDLTNKQIPLTFDINLKIKVGPVGYSETDKNGNVRESKWFHFEIMVDTFNNLFILPKQVDDLGNETPCYTLTDIIEAASGNTVKASKIDSITKQYVEDFANIHILKPEWQEVLYNGSKDFLLQEFNTVHKARCNQTNVNYTPLQLTDMPQKAYCYQTLTQEQIELIVSSAKDIIE